MGQNDETTRADADGGWGPELEELTRRRADADGLGGPAAVAKHHAQGRLTIR